MKNSKKLQYSEMDKIFKKIIKLFRLVQGKDIFEEKYKSDLGKRLLLEKSTSSDSEIKMISLLKEECGNVYTSKLEGIMKDIESSKEIQNRFEDFDEYKEYKSNTKINMCVRVITPSIIK